MKWRYLSVPVHFHSARLRIGFGSSACRRDLGCGCGCGSGSCPGSGFCSCSGPAGRCLWSARAAARYPPPPRLPLAAPRDRLRCRFQLCSTARAHAAATAPGCPAQATIGTGQPPRHHPRESEAIIVRERSVGVPSLDSAGCFESPGGFGGSAQADLPSGCCGGCASRGGYAGSGCSRCGRSMGCGTTPARPSAASETRPQSRPRRARSAPQSRSWC